MLPFLYTLGTRTPEVFPCTVAMDNVVTASDSVIVPSAPGRCIIVHWIHVGGAQGGVAGAIRIRAGADILFSFSILANTAGHQFFLLNPPWCLPEGADLIVTRTAALGAYRGTFGYNYALMA